MADVSVHAIGRRRADAVANMGVLTYITALLLRAASAPYKLFLVSWCYGRRFEGRETSPLIDLDLWNTLLVGEALRRGGRFIAKRAHHKKKDVRTVSGDDMRAILGGSSPTKKRPVEEDAESRRARKEEKRRRKAAKKAKKGKA